MTYISTALTATCLILTGTVTRTANADEPQRGDSGPGTDVQSSTHDGHDLHTQPEPFELNFGALQDDSSEANGWRVNFNTWIWLAGLEGEVGARGLTVDVSADFGDILDASDSILAFSGRLEIAKGRWGGFIDGMYMNLGVDDVTGPLGFADIDVTFEMILIDFGATYRIGEWAPSGGK